jgi:hypothetical protein
LKKKFFIVDFSLFKVPSEGYLELKAALMLINLKFKPHLFFFEDYSHDKITSKGTCQVPEWG